MRWAHLVRVSLPCLLVLGELLKNLAFWSDVINVDLACEVWSLKDRIGSRIQVSN